MSIEPETIQRKLATMNAAPTLVLVPPSGYPPVQPAAVAIPASGRMSPGDRQDLRNMLVQWSEEDLAGDPDQQDRSWELLSRLLDEDRP